MMKKMKQDTAVRLMIILLSGLPRVALAFVGFAIPAIRALMHPEKKRDWRFAYAYLVFPVGVGVLMLLVSILVKYVLSFPWNWLLIMVWCVFMVIQGFMHYGGQSDFWNEWINAGGESLQAPERVAEEPKINQKVKDPQWAERFVRYAATHNPGELSDIGVEHLCHEILSNRALSHLAKYYLLTALLQRTWNFHPDGMAAAVCVRLLGLIEQERQVCNVE